MRKRSVITGHALLEQALCGAALSAACILLPSQEAPPIPEPSNNAAVNPSGAPMTVRGVVLNAATGQPLPRALVRTFNPALGALTDSDGRFEITGVFTGVTSFEVIKPGFDERGESDEGPGVTTHMVTVAAGMPELTFQLAPTNVIHGYVTLSTDAPAEGIGLTLLFKTVREGRAGWTRIDSHQTTPAGDFRFSGLRDGTYLILTDPEFENGNDSGAVCNADGPADAPGYAARFYDDTQELASAARIVVAGGQNAEVALALNLTQLHLVTASPLRAPTGGGWSFANELYGQNGQELEYPMRELQDHSLCVYLPDGSYALAMEATKEDEASANGLAQPQGVVPSRLSGVVQFSVEGHAVRHLHIPLAEDVGTQVHVRYEPGPPKPIPQVQQAEDHNGPEDLGDFEPSNDVLDLSAERVNTVGPQGRGLEANRLDEDTYTLRATAPGAYWIQASASQQGTCMGAVTAGGEDLARTPWTADANGVGAPIDVVVRTDCAKLTVELPPATESAGEDRPIFVYAVPEFDSMEGVSQSQPRMYQQGGNTEEIPDLPPGVYRIYAFHKQRSIEYRNPDALERLGPGQEVTLEPNGNASVAIQTVSE